MASLEFILNGFVVGFSSFIVVELFRNALYSWPTLFVSVIMGIVVLRVLLLRFPNIIAWVLTGSLVAGVTALVRIGIPIEGYFPFVPGLHTFATRHTDAYSYFLFFLSGAAAGALLVRQNPTTRLHQLVCIAGISLGVLYHMEVAVGFVSMQPVKIVVIFIGEFFAPTVFAYSLGLLVRRWN